MLLEKVNEYEASFPLTMMEQEVYQNTKIDLEEKLFEQAKGMLFRSKVKWQEEGERNTKYFFNLEKARYNAKTCYKLIDKNGKEIIEDSLILETQKSFYNDLYSEDKEVSFMLKNTYNIKVPEIVKKDQEKTISIEEVGLAIKKMNNDKTPGEDGISVDFYKVFWAGLKDPFMSMIQQVFDEANCMRLQEKVF